MPAALSVKRRLIGIIIIGENDAFNPGGHAVALDHRAGRRGQHDAGPVIIGEGDGPLDGPGGKDHLPGADLPQPVTWHAFTQQCGIMIGHALKQHQVIMVPMAHDSRAGQEMHVPR